MQKSIRDQIIECLQDGGSLTRVRAHTDRHSYKCRSKEAAKKPVANSSPGAQQRKYHKCPGCGGTQQKGGRFHCPAYDRICSCCHKVGHFARVCRSKERPHQQVPISNSSQPAAMQVSLYSIILINSTGFTVCLLATLFCVGICTSLLLTLFMGTLCSQLHYMH